MKKDYIYNHKTLRENIYDELKDKILKGDIIPGTKLVELDISNRMGVSRTPVREAIRMLADDKLVTIEQNKGAFVSKVAASDIYEILESREVLDAATTYYAARRISENLKEKLRVAKENYEKAFARGDEEEMVRWDTTFHRVIVEATGNKILIQLGEQIREVVLRFRYIYYGYRMQEHIVREHQQIYDAILSGNSVEAGRIARLHVKNIRDDIAREYR